MKSTSAGLSSLRSILGENRPYTIPPYQRRYTWGIQRVEELWEDVVGMYKDRDHRKDEYLLGPIVTVEHDGVEDVVDGQQRLVSLTLMFCALRDSLESCLIRSNGDLKSEIKSAIREINDRIVDGTKTFIDLNNKEDSLLLEAICRSDKTGIDLKLLRRDASKAIRRNYDELRRRANYLYDQLGIMKSDLTGINNLKEILKSMTDRVFVIDVTVKKEKDAQQIFQALNSTGQQLTQADLIKNYLILNSQGGQNVEGEWKKAFACFDKEIRKSPKKADNYIYDSLLSRNYQASIRSVKNENEWRDTHEKQASSLESTKTRQGKDVGKRELYDAVKDKLKSGYTPKEFILDLERDLKIIHVLENPQLKDSELNHMLYGLKQVHAVYFRRPIIAAVRKWDWQNRKTYNLINFLLKFFFMYRTVCKMDVDKIRSIARELTREIELQDDVEVTDLCKKITGKIPDLEKFHGQFRDEFIKQEYTTDAAKYILISIERNLQTEFEVQSKFDIEHVFPQKAKSTAWSNWEELEPYKDNIANLTLLPSRWNKALQNYKFDVKKTGVKDGGDVVTLRGKSGKDVHGNQIKISYNTSRLELNKYFQGCDKWNKEQIQKRQKELLNHAKMIWDLEEFLKAYGKS